MEVGEQMHSQCRSGSCRASGNYGHHSLGEERVLKAILSWGGCKARRSFVDFWQRRKKKTLFDQVCLEENSKFLITGYQEKDVLRKFA